MQNLGKCTINELFEMMGLLKKMIKAPDMPEDSIPFVESQINEVEQELVTRPASGLITYADKIMGTQTEGNFLPGMWPLKKNPF